MPNWKSNFKVLISLGWAFLRLLVDLCETQRKCSSSSNIRFIEHEVSTRKLGPSSGIRPRFPNRPIYTFMLLCSGVATHRPKSISIKQWCLNVCSHFIGHMRIPASASDMFGPTGPRNRWWFFIDQIVDLRIIEITLPQGKPNPASQKSRLTKTLLCTWHCKLFWKSDGFLQTFYSWVGLSGKKFQNPTVHRAFLAMNCQGNIISLGRMIAPLEGGVQTNKRPETYVYLIKLLFLFILRRR